MSASEQARRVTAELLSRYDQPGPRYTSYPTAVEFHEGFTESDYREALARANVLSEAAWSVYAHIPFCEKRCTFCGCHVFATTKKTVADPYVAHVLREMKMVAALLPNRRTIAQFHLGGGTPTYLSSDQLGLLLDGIDVDFDFAAGAELAVEVDPRVTTNEQLDLLASRGFNRFSVGVQDFTPQVQQAVGRIQTPERTFALVDYARSRGFRGINIDLIYGLPYQREESFAQTLDLVVETRPDRVAVYSFAYIPWLRGHQKRLPKDAFPGREEKFSLLALAREKLIGAGYQAIGMDHFAVPEDELAVAQREGRLYRNFMGYTVMPGVDALGFGVSAIGDVQGAFVQNEKKLSTYYSAIGADRLPVQKGYARTRDDEIRRYVIQTLMCNARVSRSDVEAAFGVHFPTYFANALEVLKPHVDEGMCVVDDEGIHATELGQLFVRNLAMCFDAYLPKKREQNRPVFSRTV